MEDDTNDLSFDAVMALVDKLLAIEDPESTPYTSRYAAVDKLVRNPHLNGPEPF